MPHKQVVIIGGGFGGLTAAQSLRDVDVCAHRPHQSSSVSTIALPGGHVCAVSRGYRVAIAHDLSAVSACSRGHG